MSTDSRSWLVLCATLVSCGSSDTLRNPPQVWLAPDNGSEIHLQLQPVQPIPF